MYYVESSVFPKQVLVPGRGVELADDLLPGTAQQGSRHSGESYDLAVATAQYCADHHVDQIIFSGRWSSTLPETKVPLNGTEATAIHSVALDKGLDPEIPCYDEVDAKSTYGNFINSRGYISSIEPLGVVMRGDLKLKRKIVKMGNLVLPHNLLVPIYTNKPGIDHSNTGFNSKDMASVALYTVAMLGVTPGDIDAIEWRDQQLVQKPVQSLLAFGGQLAASLHRSKAIRN